MGLKNALKKVITEHSTKYNGGKVWEIKERDYMNGDVILDIEMSVTRKTKRQKSKMKGKGVECFPYDNTATNHVINDDASQCYTSLDKAYFSFGNSSDFEYFLNGLQNKINQYRKMVIK